MEDQKIWRDGGKAGIGTAIVKLPKFGGYMSGAVFPCQFEAVVDHIGWVSTQSQDPSEVQISTGIYSNL
jgi:hypothetical protein